jgi:hypothetical protein
MRLERFCSRRSLGEIGWIEWKIWSIKLREGVPMRAARWTSSSKRSTFHRCWTR